MICTQWFLESVRATRRGHAFSSRSLNMPVTSGVLRLISTLVSRLENKRRDECPRHVQY